MATPIRIKRSAVPGKRPAVSDLRTGELALNTFDAEIYTLRDRFSQTGIGTEVVRLGAGATVTNVIYVTTDGSDTNTGRKLGDAKATVGAALSIATEGSVVRVSAGSYIENNPLVLSKQVSIVGDSLREVSISPQNSDEDLFYVSEGNYIAEMSFTGSLNSGKAIFAFNPNQVGFSSQSPYIQNCTNFIPNSIGMKIDGSKCIGPLKSMVLDSYTQYNQNGIGVSITNEGYAQLVSLFTICSDTAVFCGSGAACDLTNSNSSFGNFGLVADSVGPKKYTGVITESSAQNADTFVLNLNTPTFNVVSATYDNLSGIVTITTDAPHNFSVGMGVTISGLGFTCDYEPGILYYPSGKKGYIFETVTVAPGRYVDAYNSIQSNIREIKDKSIARIALEHPDFVFPGDPAASERFRYYDSYRLIQKNKQEIVDKSLASIAVGFPSDFSFPDDPYPYERNRYYDASGLIQRNRQEIVDKALASLAVGFPSSFSFPDDPSPYERNRYYDASGLIQQNRAVIVNSAWNDTVSAYPMISGTETTCKRDLGFFVDAIATDVFIGGNRYAREFSNQYINGTGAGSLSGEEEETIYAFNSAREYMKQAITNTLVGAAYSNTNVSTGTSIYGGGGGIYANTDPGACFDVQQNINTLVGIVTTVIGAGDTSSLGTFSENLGISTINLCARDLGFFVEAIATDVFTGGNKYARDFSLQYFVGTASSSLYGEEQQSIYAFHSARDYAIKAVTNQLNVKNVGISSGPATYGGPGIALTVYPSGNPDSCADVQSNIINLVGIVTTVIGAGNTSSLGSFSENLGISTTNICARDLGYLVDAVSTDVFTGGNKYSRDFTTFYFDGTTPTGIGTSERLQSAYSFLKLGEYSKKAITNQLNYKEVGISSGPATYGGGGGNIPILLSGNPASCADVQSNIDNLVGIVTTVIGNSDPDYLNSFSENLGTFPTGSSKCFRDIGYIINAVSTDVRDYTSENTIDATKYYFNLNGTALTKGIVGEEDETITAFTAARDYMKLAIANRLNNRNLDLVPDPLTGSNLDPASCANVQSFIDNLVGILTTRLSAGNIIGPNSLPPVSRPSTVFSAYVGISTLAHTYNSGGTVRLDVVRPFDGQVIYFGDLFYSIGGVTVGYGGTGYTGNAEVSIDIPEIDWGIPATAVAEVKNGIVVNVEMVSNGRGYGAVAPTVTFSAPSVGINTATGTARLIPTYYVITKSTPVTAGICTITISDNVPYSVGVGVTVPFYKQSRVLASGHSLEYIGSGTEINAALPKNGGVPIQEHEVDMRNGGLVVYTSTDQSGNFRIGEGVVINQQAGTISGTFYSKSLFSSLTPFILALGGE